MIGFDHGAFNGVHEEVLSEIARDYLTGHRFYEKNRVLYDSLSAIWG